MTTGTLPQKFLFMKVGNHAGETWEQILERKRKEYERSGQIFWGYGGSACHPTKQVQPFARLTLEKQEEIVLIMHPVRSNWDQEMIFATEFSKDGKLWEPLPKGVSVSGSKFALVLDEVKPGDLEIPLNEYEVGIGPSAGKAAEEYLQGRTDKACFVRSATPRAEHPKGAYKKKAGFVAKLKEPYAVLLR